MRKKAISLLLIVVLIAIIKTPVTAQRSEEEILLLYENWLTKHKKSLNFLEEMESRFKVFKDNLLYIDAHNAGEHTFRLGLNRFAGLTNDEFRAEFFGYSSFAQRSRRSSFRNNRYMFVEGESLPDFVDWRENGAVVGVKDQGRCKGSWAFSAAAGVEGINKIVTGDLISISEQELLDCDRSFNNGCKGGRMDYAFDFIIENGGIDSEEDYPYIGLPRKCDIHKKSARLVKIDTYEYLPENDEKSLKKSIVQQPISVAIEGSGKDFQFYESGIFNGSCGNNLDHGVAVVGYGSENVNYYWIIKNSWGTEWGEDGYVRLARNVGLATGKCGIAMEASYPVKTSPNPPNPGPSPPSPSVCDNYYTCPSRTTCCCVYKHNSFCFSWQCCPHDYPICNTRVGTCLMSKNNPLGVKALAFSDANVI